jgi:RHS repeat-associated protein
LNLGIEWDAENRLIAVKQGGNTLASFTYDEEGRRSTKSAGGVTTTYLYDGARFLEERPSVGLTKRYVYGRGIDQPLAQVVGGVISYNVADHLGSIVRGTDSLGAPTLTRLYDPWGNPIQGATTSGYAFTGREWDAETSVYYYRARYYDPKIARFLSEDEMSSSDGPNRFAYVRKSPARGRDPSGRYTLAASAEPFSDDIDTGMLWLQKLLPVQPDRCCLKWFEKHGTNPLPWIVPGGPPEIRVEDLRPGERGYTQAPFTFLVLDSKMLKNIGVANQWDCASTTLHEFGHFAGKRPRDGFVKACTFYGLEPAADDF